MLKTAKIRHVDFRAYTGSTRFQTPELSHILKSRSVPDVDWVEASKRQNKWPFAFWNFCLSKGTRVAIYFSHVWLSVSIPLHLATCGSFQRRKIKGKRMVYVTKLHGSQLQATASERIILLCTYMCWKNRFLRNSISLPTRKLWWRRCYFENDSIVDCCGVEDNSFLKTETYRRQWAKLA